MNKTLLAIVGILVLLGLMGAMDVEDAQAQDALYCYEVHAGHWPDYQRTYADMCKAGELRAQR